MNRDDLDQLICKHGLESIIGPITDSILPAARFQTTRCPENDLPIGCTKFGGLPDMPPEMHWPIANDIPLTFLAQIRLDDLPRAHLTCDALPASGLLHFWYDPSDMEDDRSSGYAERGDHCFRVTYTELPMTSLLRRHFPPQPTEYPSGPYCRELIPYHACSVTTHAVVTITPEIYFDLKIPEDPDKSRVWDLWRELHGPQGEGRHRLLGHPDQIQSNMQADLYIAEQGIRPQATTAEEWAAAQRHYAPLGKEWIMLMQIDTDESGPGWTWGDVGALYFWIKKSDLAARNFSAVRGFMQAS